MYVLARRAALVSRTAIFLNNQWTIASPLSSLLQGTTTSFLPSNPIQTNAASRNVDPTDKKFNSAPAAENMHEDYVPKFLYDELLIKYGKLTDAKNELDLIKYPIKLRSEMEWYENMIASGFVADETKLQGFKDDGARRVQSRYLKWVFIMNQNHVSVNELKKSLSTPKEVNDFCFAMGDIGNDLNDYFVHDLKFFFDEKIPPFECTIKPEYDKFVNVLLRKTPKTV